VRHYRVIIEGWPNSISFKNLSKASTSLHELKMLLQYCDTGKTFWKELTAEELDTCEKEHKALILTGKIDGPAPHKCQSDYRNKRKCNTSAIDDGEQDSPLTKTYKSAETINSDDKPASTITPIAITAPLIAASFQVASPPVASSAAESLPLSALSPIALSTAATSLPIASIVAPLTTAPLILAFSVTSGPTSSP